MVVLQLQSNSSYHDDAKFWDMQVWANSTNPENLDQAASEGDISLRVTTIQEILAYAKMRKITLQLVNKSFESHSAIEISLCTDAV